MSYLKEFRKVNTSWDLPPLLPKSEVQRVYCDTPINYHNEFSTMNTKTQLCFDRTSRPSAFVQRVPVIQLSPISNINDEEEQHSVVSSNDRRSVSPSHAIPMDDTRKTIPMKRPFQEKPTSLLDLNNNNNFHATKICRKEKLKIIFNEKDINNEYIYDGVLHSKSPYEISSANYPTKRQVFFPSQDIRYVPYSAPMTDYNISPPYLPHGGIRKRARTIYTPSQLSKLEEKFKECCFIVGEDRQMLAKELKLKEQQVKIWFQNRRTKCKQDANAQDKKTL